jgi:hypothetical protein
LGEPLSELEIVGLIPRSHSLDPLLPVANDGYRVSQYESAVERTLQMPVDVFREGLRANLPDGPVDAQD